MSDKQILKIAAKGRLIPHTKFIDGREHVVCYSRKNRSKKNKELLFLDKPAPLSPIDKKILLQLENYE